jgi:hypothetical protein
MIVIVLDLFGHLLVPYLKKIIIGGQASKNERL